MFVSPGHKIDLDTSIDLVLKSCRGYRIPEPVRQAHCLVKKQQPVSDNLFVS
ncbi:MAG: hypothetical protein GY775_20175 [Candidatus Scalindua sp.]|nr:hypothetical protein [Candidatus Scalindua sp.]